VRSIRRRTALIRALIAVAVATAALAPAPGSAQEPTTEQKRDEVRAREAEITLEVDALEAEDAQIQQALTDLQTNVATQQAELDAAEQAQVEADAAVVTAEEAVARTQVQITDLDVATDTLLVEAFMNPPSDDPLDAFRAGSLSESAVKRTLIEIQSDRDQDLLDQLDEAHAELAVEQAEKEELAALAAEKKTEASTALADVEAALAQQQAFAADVEARLNARLAEAEGLKQFDAALSDQIAAEQAALAASIKAAQDAQSAPVPDVPPSTIALAPGGLATVSCPGGGSITVAGSIATNVQALLDAAYAAGVRLCGGGYRDPQQQIQLRIAHCGSSNYAIYEMPASQCDPPTARPGTSLHEQGLAIDFTCNGGGVVARGSVCWNWLSANASTYGFYNLPTESWHWSVDGT
jgi:LAS superfamily LD-carboxypeptidase LdcB